MSRNKVWWFITINYKVEDGKKPQIEVFLKEIELAHTLAQLQCINTEFIFLIKNE